MQQKLQLREGVKMKHTLMYDLIEGIAISTLFATLMFAFESLVGFTKLLILILFIGLAITIRNTYLKK